jgi:DNA-binding PadR family transcriptional regulator
MDINTLKKNKFILKRDVYLNWEIPCSDALGKLSASAIRVLLRFLQKRKWSKVGKGARSKTVYKNGGLAFTYAEADSMGIKNTTFYEAIMRLIGVGFIDLEHQGGAYGQDYSRYAISERWRDYGTENFKEVEKKRSLQRGMDVRSNVRRKIKAPTEKRSGLLRKSVVMAEDHKEQGIGFP